MAFGGFHWANMWFVIEVEEEMGGLGGEVHHRGLLASHGIFVSNGSLKRK